MLPFADLITLTCIVAQYKTCSAVKLKTTVWGHIYCLGSPVFYNSEHNLWLMASSYCRAL